MTVEQRFDDLMELQNFAEDCAERGGCKMATKFPDLLKVLTHAGTEFIIIGGAAAIAHGSAILTKDFDVVYSRSQENIERLAQL